MDVNLSGYQDNGFGGFGSEQEVDTLLKAMQAGAITGRDTTNQLLGQEPLKAESLETTLKLLDFRMKDIKLWNAIPKLPAYNTVEEYLQLVSYGSNVGGFYNEGELSDVQDSIYERRAQLVKYIQVTGEVTYQAQIVRSYVDAMRKEVENKTMWVIRKANNSLTSANSAFVSQEFNGIYAQVSDLTASGPGWTNLDTYFNSPQVIDLRGASLNQKNIEDAAINVDAAFGNVDSLFAPPTVIAGLAKDYFQRQRILLGTEGYKGEIGTNMKAIDTTFGSVGLNHDKGMKQNPAIAFATTATSTKAPNAPTWSNQVVTVDANTKFASTDAITIGKCFYAVTAINRFGESAPAFLNSGNTAVTCVAGSSVDLTFTDGGGATPASCYQIYRSQVTTATSANTAGLALYPIFRVTPAQVAAGYDGGAAGAVRDRNRFIPGTEQGFVTEMSDDVLSFKQLAPLGKLDLAVLGMSKRFIAFLFGMPLVYCPTKLVRFINIGPYTAASA